MSTNFRKRYATSFRSSRRFVRKLGKMKLFRFSCYQPASLCFLFPSLASTRVDTFLRADDIRVGLNLMYIMYIPLRWHFLCHSINCERSLLRFFLANVAFFYRHASNIRLFDNFMWSLLRNEFMRGECIFVNPIIHTIEVLLHFNTWKYKSE